jgi:hypothetical protein
MLLVVLMELGILGILMYPYASYALSESVNVDATS